MKYKLLTIALISIIIAVCIFEGICLCFQGGYLSDKKYYKEIKCMLEKAETDNRIIYTGPNTPYISYDHGTITSKYYLQDYGLIPRWSKMSKLIDSFLLAHPYIPPPERPKPRLCTE